MSTRYILAPAARQDRKEIFAYTYRRSRSIEMARRVDRKLKEEFERIARTPSIGHRNPNLPIPEHLLQGFVIHGDLPP
jgi:plasmid stabilization system protein ParE